MSQPLVYKIYSLLLVACMPDPYVLAKELACLFNRSRTV